jgi:hypothetical protein
MQVAKLRRHWLSAIKLDETHPAVFFENSMNASVSLGIEPLAIKGEPFSAQPQWALQPPFETFCIHAVRLFRVINMCDAHSGANCRDAHRFQPGPCRKSF